LVGLPEMRYFSGVEPGQSKSYVEKDIELPNVRVGATPRPNTTNAKKEVKYYPYFFIFSRSSIIRTTASRSLPFFTKSNPSDSTVSNGPSLYFCVQFS
jgi:hypothetical protein